MPGGHRLTGRPLLQPSDLSGEDFISIAAKVKARSSIDAVFDSSGVERRIRTETPWASTVCHMVAHGVGVGLVIRESAHEFAHLGYHIAAFKPRIDYRAYLITSTARPLSTAAEGFRDMLLIEFNQAKKAPRATKRS